MKGRGRTFVVDASVGGAAADPARIARGEPPNEVALACLKTLLALFEVRHTAMFSPSLDREWRDHAGEGGMRWRARMKDRGLLLAAEEPDTGELEITICTHLPAEEHRAALKDAHLVCLALTDRRLLSLNDKDRARFARLVDIAPRLGGLHWVNPARETPNVLAWIKDRAPDAAVLTLGTALPGA